MSGSAATLRPDLRMESADMAPTAMLDSEIAPVVVPSLLRATQLISERWTIPILCQIFLGARRFNEIQRNLQIPRAVLSDRLNSAVAYGLIERRADHFDGRPRLF